MTIHYSFLKWAGSKRSALNNLFKYIPREGAVFVEPFLGSATVALNTNYDRYILNDINPDLINLYKLIVKCPEKFLSDTESLFIESNNRKRAFLELRERYNTSVCPNERSLIFVYLNRHCFNGLMRYNSKGFYNTSFGKYNRPLIPEKEVYFFAEKFKKARFSSLPFESLRFNSGNDTVIYCDPPYIPKSKTASFAAYNQLGFSEKLHKKLDKNCEKWAKKGSLVFVSNHDVLLLDELYPRKITSNSFFVPRTISCKIDNRKAIKEVLMGY